MRLPLHMAERRISALNGGALDRRVAFYAARFAGQAAQTLFLAALLVVAARSADAAIGVSGLLIAGLLPSILLGIPAGALADRLHPSRAYIAGAALRVLPVLGALLLVHDAKAALVAALLAASVAQLFNPAELALVRSIHGRNAGASHSLLVLLQYIAQGVGALALGPALYFLGGPQAMFAGALAIYGVFLVLAIAAAWRLEAVAPVPHRHVTIRAACRFFLDEPRARAAVVAISLKTAVWRGVFVALPLYVQSSVGLGNEAIAFVVAPGVVGALLGLAWCARNVNPDTAESAMRLSIMAMVVGVLALAVLDYGVQAAVLITQVGLLVRFEASLNTTFIIALPAAFLIGLGFVGALIGGRVALTGTAPEGQQARTFAVQGTITECLLLLPLLLTGVGTETVGARATLGALGLVAAGAFLLVEVPRLLRRPPLATAAGAEAAVS